MPLSDIVYIRAASTIPEKSPVADIVRETLSLSISGRMYTTTSSLSFSESASFDLSIVANKYESSSFGINLLS